MKSEVVYGLHAIAAVLKNRRQAILELYVLQGRHDRRLQDLIRKAKGLALINKSRIELNKIAGSEQHQGIVALMESGVSNTSNMLPEAEISNFLKNLSRPALVLIIDGVTDPQNFGACLRSADAAGVDLVVTPKDKSVGLTPVVRKVACGAAEVVRLCQVTNLARAMETLQKSGVWIYGAAGEADKSVFEMHLNGSVAIAVGAEDTGLRRLTREKCDHLMHIPMSGSVSSLNVSVATGVCLFEAVRQRN